MREESPLGLITVRESADRAQSLGVPGRVQTDLLQAAAVVPAMRQRIDEPRDVRLLRLELDGADLTNADLQGAGQTVHGSTIELIDPQTLQPGPADPDIEQYLKPEPLIESDAPEIRAEAEKAIAGVDGTRARAEKLTRYVNALLDKKPTVSLPSAREVLQNEGRRLQRAHGAVRRDGALDWHPGAHRGRSRLRPRHHRRVLLPRVARGLHRRRDPAAACGCRSIRR